MIRIFGSMFGIMAILVFVYGCSSSKVEQDDALFGEEISMDGADAETDELPADEEEVGTDEEATQGDDEVTQTDEEPAPGFDEPVVAAAGAAVSYTVNKGDTLMKIAFEKFGDIYAWKKIYEANRDILTDPNVVPAGTVLKIEEPSAPVVIDQTGDKKHLIRQGETLGSISGEIYGTASKWKKLWEYNKQLIQDPNKIYAGFYLYYSVSPQEEQDAIQFKNQNLAGPGGGGAFPEQAAQPQDTGFGEGTTDTMSPPAAADQFSAPPSEQTDSFGAPREPAGGE